MNPSTSKLNNRGFTLIEAMICIFIVSISLLAVSKMQISSLFGNRIAMDFIQAGLFSSAAADQLICSDYTGSTLNPPDENYQTLKVIDKYTIQYKVKNMTLLFDQTFKIVNITTSWETNNKTHSITNTITILNSLSTSSSNS